MRARPKQGGDTIRLKICLHLVEDIIFITDAVLLSFNKDHQHACHQIDTVRAGRSWFLAASRLGSDSTWLAGKITREMW